MLRKRISDDSEARAAAVTSSTPVRAYICSRCGDPFVPRASTGRPRERCYTCKPDTAKSAQRVPQKAKRASGAEFTVPHFVDWASQIILDNNEPWIPDPFFCDFLEDSVFAGVPECWLLVPEGNGKTTSIAGLVLYYLRHQPGARIPWAASSREQASIGFEQGQGIIIRTDGFDDQFRALYGYREIRLRDEEASKIQIFSADDRTGDGIIPTLGIIDELHRHKNMALYRTWRGKLPKRGGQIIVISTAGEPKSEFENARESIRQHGEITGSQFFVCSKSKGIVLHDWSVPDGLPTDNMDVVKAANPSPRITAETLADKFDSPTNSLSHWSRFVCNRPTRDMRSAITEAEWLMSTSKREIPPGAEIQLGLDIAFKQDTTAIVPCWFESDEFHLFGPAVVLVPPRNGDQLEPIEIKRALQHFVSRYSVKRIVMDTSHAADVASWIRTDLDIDMVDRGQTNQLAVLDYQRFMEGLRTGVLFHSGDAGLTAHAMNAIEYLLPGGDTKFARIDKSRGSVEAQDRRVIDALVAASMVHSSMIQDIIDGMRKPASAVDWDEIDFGEDA